MDFYRRMIAASPRDCDNCGEEGIIAEGEMFWIDKREDKFCRTCIEYIQMGEQ